MNSCQSIRLKGVSLDTHTGTEDCWENSGGEKGETNKEEDATQTSESMAI